VHNDMQIISHYSLFAELIYQSTTILCIRL